MNQFFQMIISTIRYRYAAMTAKFRHWTNKEFVRAKFIVWFKMRLQSVLSVRPRDKKDYYTMLGFMVSRRLVHAVVIFAGLICFCYLWYVNPISFSDGEAIKRKTYTYNSFPLKFLDADVDITAKGGYVAYSGHVKGGYAEGLGELYNKEGALVYSGNFSKSKFHGTGMHYYDSGQLQYSGDFVNNIYEGNGKLYRENGMVYYVGEFMNGYPDGKGDLYNQASKLIYSGIFKRGDLVYTQLLGKTAREISEAYVGNQKIYFYEDKTMIALEEIGALYISKNHENSLEDSQTAESVYVIRDSIVIGENKIDRISQLKKLLGEPQYEGNSYVTFYDAIAVNWGCEQGKISGIDIEIAYEKEYDEVIQVNTYDSQKLIYMYVYEIDGLNYTFMTKGYDDKFMMYVIAE